MDGECLLDPPLASKSSHSRSLGSHPGRNFRLGQPSAFPSLATEPSQQGEPFACSSYSALTAGRFRILLIISLYVSIGLQQTNRASTSLSLFRPFPRVAGRPAAGTGRRIVHNVPVDGDLNGGRAGQVGLDADLARCAARCATGRETEEDSMDVCSLGRQGGLEAIVGQVTSRMRNGFPL